MTRVPQPEGTRGSLKWIQRAVNERPAEFDSLILAHLDSATRIDWRSPLADDDFAEYRDAAFLERVGAGHLSGALDRFWPTRGPQWDALARTDAEDILLIEAKAHIDEMCSPPTQAKGASRARIDSAMTSAIEATKSTPHAPWTDLFYQLANRIAHLHFLRANGEKAWLVLVNFVGDADMAGPESAAEWEAAYLVASHVMGLGKRNPLGRYIIHIYPQAQ